MINIIIRIVKKSPFLYNLAKKINRKRNPMPLPKTNKSILYYSYIMKEESDLEKIKENYSQIKKYNSKLFILVKNESLNLSLHKFIRKNPDICFASFDYFKKYRSFLSCFKAIWINIADEDRELLKYLN